MLLVSLALPKLHVQIPSTLFSLRMAFAAPSLHTHTHRHTHTPSAKTNPRHGTLNLRATTLSGIASAESLQGYWGLPQGTPLADVLAAF